MLPEARLSSSLVSADYIVPIFDSNQPLKDEALSREGDIWSAYYDSGTIYVVNHLDATLYTLAVAECTQLGLALDQNDFPVLAVQTSTGGSVRYWNGSWQSTSLPIGATDLVANLDDPRKSQSPISDVIVAYRFNDSLRYVQQRDNYTIERVLAESGIERLLGFGMNKQNRLQFKTIGDAVTPVVNGDATIAAMFDGGEIGAWYDLSDISTLWQNVEGTTPVVATGDPIRRIDDKSGNGNYTILVGAGTVPIYQTSGGLHWIQLDTTAQHFATVASSISGIRHVVCAAMYGSATFIGYNGLLCMNTAEDDSLFFTGSAGGTTQWYQNATPYVRRRNGIVTEQAAMNTPAVFSTQRSAAATTSSIILFRDRTIAGREWQGRFYGAILIDRQLSDSERDSAESYFAAKCGVSL